MCLTNYIITVNSSVKKNVNTFKRAELNILMKSRSLGERLTTYSNNSSTIIYDEDSSQM